VSGLLRGGVAAASGLVAAAAFEPVGWGYLAVLAVAGLSWALHGARGRAAFGTGLVFGLAFMLALLPWLQVIGVDAWIGLSFLEALFFGVLGVLVAPVSRLPGGPVWAACCWVAVELARSTLPWGGFPWGRIAFATLDTPLAPAMAWVGAGGTTFLVALLGTTLAWLLRPAARGVTGRSRSPRDRVLPPSPGRGTALLGTVAVLAVAALPALLPLPHGDEAPESTLRVAAVQGNVPGEGMDAFAERRAVLDNHVEATHELARRIGAGETEQPDVVLWPENSTDIDPFEDPSVHADIQGAVDAVGLPVLVGAMVGGPGERDVRNQGILWAPGTGPADAYSKTKPVPFGEYIPHRAQLAQLFERLDQIPRDMVPGTEPGLFDVAGTTLGDVICFEIAYDEVVHDVTRLGAEVLVVQTNNATYMGTGQVEQQFAIARLRALETSRYVVVVATNGVSGVIAPDGSVVERAPVRETVVMEHDVPLRTVITPAVHVSRWVEMALTLLAALALSASIAVDRRSRRGGRVAVPTDGPTAAPAPDPAAAR
jgi:apolipoprotein N-acyltransferase